MRILRNQLQKFHIMSQNGPTTRGTQRAPWHLGLLLPWRTLRAPRPFSTSGLLFLTSASIPLVVPRHLPIKRGLQRSAYVRQTAVCLDHLAFLNHLFVWISLRSSSRCDKVGLHNNRDSPCFPGDMVIDAEMSPRLDHKLAIRKTLAYNMCI